MEGSKRERTPDRGPARRLCADASPPRHTGTADVAPCLVEVAPGNKPRSLVGSLLVQAEKGWHGCLFSPPVVGGMGGMAGKSPFIFGEDKLTPNY